jgi:hypothetical protein
MSASRKFGTAMPMKPTKVKMPHRREDADRQRKPPGDHEGGEGEQQGQPNAVADHLGDRPAPFHGLAEIAGDDAGDPFGVLHVFRLVEPVELAHGRGRLGRHRRAGGGEVGDIGVHEVAWRQLDDGEGQHRDHPDRGQPEQQPPCEEGDQERAVTT